MLYCTPNTFKKITASLFWGDRNKYFCEISSTKYQNIMCNFIYIKIK